MKSLSLSKITTGRGKILALICCLILLGSASTAITIDYLKQRSTIATLKTEQSRLSKELETLRHNLNTQAKTTETAAQSYEASLKTQQDKIAALEAKLADLEKKVSSNRSQPLAATPRPANPKPATVTSVYDRIISSDPAAKARFIDAIKLIETNTPTYFNILKTQVQEIRLVTTLGCAGGLQQQRIIYISYQAGNCLTYTPTSTFASVVIHESYHVYNVYVNKVYGYGKHQELPSLYAQRSTFDALGVEQSYRDQVNATIAYYESL